MFQPLFSNLSFKYGWGGYNRNLILPIASY